VRLEDISYHYDIFEKVDVNGFTVVSTPIYCDRYKDKNIYKEKDFWFQVFIFNPDGSLIPCQRQILGYENIDYDRITGEINRALLMQDLGLS